MKDKSIFTLMTNERLTDKWKTICRYVQILKSSLFTTTQMFHIYKWDHNHINKKKNDHAKVNHHYKAILLNLLSQLIFNSVLHSHEVDLYFYFSIFAYLRLD